MDWATAGTVLPIAIGVGGLVIGALGWWKPRAPKRQPDPVGWTMSPGKGSTFVITNRSTETTAVDVVLGIERRTGVVVRDAGPKGDVAPGGAVSLVVVVPWQSRPPVVVVEWVEQGRRRSWRSELPR